MKMTILLLSLGLCLSACSKKTRPDDETSNRAETNATSNTKTAAETNGDTSAEGTGAATAAKTTAVASDLCALSSAESWKECTDKKVQVVGPPPKMVYNHPVPGGPVSYIEVEGVGQIVVQGQAEGCSGDLKAVGMLKRIDLGGPAGTRKSYKGWRIENATVSCAP